VGADGDRVFVIGSSSGCRPVGRIWSYDERLRAARTPAGIISRSPLYRHVRQSSGRHAAATRATNVIVRPVEIGPRDLRAGYELGLGASPLTSCALTPRGPADASRYTPTLLSASRGRRYTRYQSSPAISAPSRYFAAMWPSCGANARGHEATSTVRSWCWLSCSRCGSAGVRGDDAAVASARR
ncbi:MAG: hypothetical protein QOK11_3426, partial [Pseudonocardiales bacterium]|nr:hypothetical protein [Pseudonocardiales bacterium]